MLPPHCESAMRWAARPLFRKEEVVGMLLSWWSWGQQALLEGKEGWQQCAALRCVDETMCSSQHLMGPLGACGCSCHVEICTLTH